MTTLTTAAPASGSDRARGYAECWAILREHGKTFHVMAKLLGPERGDAIAALYGFARIADDLVDERPPDARPEAIRAELHQMLADLRRAVAGDAPNARYLVLGETIRKYGIPLEPFDHLVAGLEMDLDGLRYGTFADLEHYCYRVAGTIGLMITPVAGYREGTAALEHAKTLGTAMQLTNILRDVGEDHARGMIYLPEEDLGRFGLCAGDLPRQANDPSFRALMEFEIARARRLYDEGLALIPLMTTARGRAAFQFAADAYGAILDKIRANGFDVFSRRASLTVSEKLSMIPVSTWRAWRAGLAGRHEGPAGNGRPHAP
ncbi:phytoene/squalene synthase family protein [Anaeromyxobacter oryzae]|uniref:Squalene synthase n=1 Tax=Anaeromyxobacter oryzae TaxID=2918170 RepID=A0ABM7WRZ1_9BACT|nr:phytoene/squalene synthase family protein [Anaeromyxobacter oryzae]BDG02222.1 squalene synthase [Anaeromyxobacter oryzae]